MSAALAGHHGPIYIRLSFPHPLSVSSGHVESTGVLPYISSVVVIIVACTVFNFADVGEERYLL